MSVASSNPMRSRPAEYPRVRAVRSFMNHHLNPCAATCICTSFVPRARCSGLVWADTFSPCLNGPPPNSGTRTTKSSAEHARCVVERLPLLQLAGTLTVPLRHSEGIDLALRLRTGPTQDILRRGAAELMTG